MRGEDDEMADISSSVGDRVASRGRSSTPSFKTSGRDSRLRNFRDDVIVMPVQDNDGKAIWQGDRKSLGGFSEDLVVEVLESFYTGNSKGLSKRTTSSGIEEYECPKCRNFVARKRDLPMSAKNHISIDHKKSIREYVVSNVQPVTDTLDGHVWTFYPMAACIEAHRDPTNLSPLCQSCNSSKSGSKDLDGEMRDHDPKNCRHKLCGSKRTKATKDDSDGK